MDPERSQYTTLNKMADNIMSSKRRLNRTEKLRPVHHREILHNVQTSNGHPQ